MSRHPMIIRLKPLALGEPQLFWAGGPRWTKELKQAVVCLDECALPGSVQIFGVRAWRRRDNCYWVRGGAVTQPVAEAVPR